MLEPARLSHRIQGRVRLRFPGRIKDLVYIEGVTGWASARPAVISATGNARTGSVLLRHEADFSLTDFAAAAAEAGWFDLPLASLAQPAAMPVPKDPLALARVIDASTRGLYPPWAFGVLLGLGSVQAARGQWLPPALTLLWYARELMGEKGYGRGPTG